MVCRISSFSHSPTRGRFPWCDVVVIIVACGFFPAKLCEFRQNYAVLVEVGYKGKPTKLDPNACDRFLGVPIRVSHRSNSVVYVALPWDSNKYNNNDKN